MILSEWTTESTLESEAVSPSERPPERQRFKELALPIIVFTDRYSNSFYY